MLTHYLKLAIKVLGRRKVFTAISLFGIGVTLTVLVVASALVDSVFGPMPPETRLDRSLGILMAELRGETAERNGFAGYKFLDEHVKTLPGVEVVTIHSTVSTGVSYVGGERVSSFLKRTDGEFWRAMDFHFLEGGPYTPEDVANARPAAVINASTRARFFGSAPALGKTLEVDGQRFEVVGVVPDVPILRFVPFSDVWVGISTSKSESYRAELVGDFMATIVAKSRSDLPRIQAEVAARAAALKPDKPFESYHSYAETLFETASRMLLDGWHGEAPVTRLKLLVGALVLLFMALPAINLVNLNVSRILERAPEIGVRKAFGASSRSLVLQFVMENVLLCLVGGLLGLAASSLILSAVNGSGLIPYAALRLNPRVFAWGFFFAAAFGVLSGVWPAYRMSRLHPVEALRGRSR